MLDTAFQRFNGDVGNALTWDFPVIYKIVEGASAAKVTDLAHHDLLQPFLDAADELVAAGVDGITTTCGFLSLYQSALAAHCPVPVATSALLQVPLVARTLPAGKRVGILTFSAERLTRAHLECAGIDPATPVAGLPPGGEFQRAIIEGDATVPFAVLQREVLDTARRFVASDPSIGALVCECTNLPPYACDLRDALGLPVFDMVTLIEWFRRGLQPRRFAQG